MECFTSALLPIIHVLAGSIALLSGIAALVLSPNTKRHRPVGKVFFYAMTIVFITAVYLSLQKGLTFLLAIGILSYFSVAIGIRALAFFKGKKVTKWDWLLVVTLFIAGGFLAFIGTLYFLKAGLVGGTIVHWFFGFGMVLYAGMCGSELVKTKPKSRRWLQLHQSNMGAAVIATITAFFTNTMEWMPSVLEWVLPTIILSPLLSIYIRKSNKTALTK